MTLTLELTPEEEKQLQAAANRHGIDIARYTRWMLGLEASAAPRVPLSEAEWERLEEELAEGIGPEIPPLSDENLSRSSIYGHRA